MRSQREDEGWIRVWLALDAARCGWEGKKRWGEKVLAVGEIFRGRDLSGVLSPAKNPYVSLQIEPPLPPELSFKGAPSPTLSQRWTAIGELNMQGGKRRLECFFKIHNRNGGAKIHIDITGFTSRCLTIQSNGLVGMFSSFFSKATQTPDVRQTALKLPFKHTFCMYFEPC